MKGRCSYQPATDEWIDGSWIVDCSCGVTFDDGEEMVECNLCGIWEHTRCARFTKGDSNIFTCHNCKPAPPVASGTGTRRIPSADPIPSDNENEEAEVAQLLVELPSKTAPSLLPPIRRWVQLPLQDKVHVQGVPGGDPSLFQGNLSSVFNMNLWRCTGYVPKKFNFEYLEFPCWKEGNDEEGGGEGREGLSKASQGADALFALSKQAEVAAVSFPQNSVRKIFKLGDTVDRANKKKEKHKARDSSSGDCSTKKKKKKHKDTHGGERKDKDKKPSSSSADTEKKGPVQVEDSVIPEGKSETQIDETLVEPNLSDHDVGESFGDTREDMEIDKVPKILDDNILPDIVEKIETNQSNEFQEKMKDESNQDIIIPIKIINSSKDLERNSDIDKVVIKPEESKLKDTNLQSTMSQHDVSKTEAAFEPATEESNTSGAPKASSVTPSVHRGPGPSTEQSKERSLKNPIIYHAKAQASKVSSSSNTLLKHNKPVETKPTATCHAVDESTSSSSKNKLPPSDTPEAPAKLSDEQLALLLHQQLNSSPRVPRVPRLRHAPGVQTLNPKRPSSSLTRDHASGVKKKYKEDVTRESSKSTGQSNSASKDSTTSSNPPVEPSDCTSQKYPSLPGLIDEILNGNSDVTYEEICRNVSLHWRNLRKPNGERYAYSSPNHAVHDILRGRKEWAHLLDQAPKAYLSKKRKNAITEEKNMMKKSEEESEEDKTEDFPKGKRKARKRRKLELRGQSLRDATKRKHSGSENSSGPSDSSSDDDEDEVGKDDDILSSDDDSGAQTAGSSSSD